MAELNRKLDHFTATILAEATAETERAMAQLKEKRDAAWSAAEDKVLSETYHYIRNEVARLKSDSGRRVSRRMLDDKQELYRRREEISAEVFAQVREKIEAYVHTPAYAERLKTLLAQSVEVLKGTGDIRVYLQPDDRDRITDLAASLPSIKLEFCTGDFLLGGLVAESPSLGRRVDATFDSALEELDGHFAELFGLSLSDQMDGDADA